MSIAVNMHFDMDGISHTIKIKSGYTCNNSHGLHRGEGIGTL